MYSIVDGNTGDAFYIEQETGKIKVKNHLDYETVTSVSDALPLDERFSLPSRPNPFFRFPSHIF